MALSVTVSVDLWDVKKLLEQACVFRVNQKVPHVCVRERGKGRVI